MSEQLQIPSNPPRKYRKRASRVPVKPRLLERTDEPSGAEDDDRMCQSPAEDSADVMRFVLDLPEADRKEYADLVGQPASPEARLAWLVGRGFAMRPLPAPVAIRQLSLRLRTIHFVARASMEITGAIQASGLDDAGRISSTLLEQKLTQFLYREMNGKRELDAAGWQRLSRLVGDAIGRRIQLEKLGKLTASRPSGDSSVMAAKRMTAREVAERVRYALLGPAPADADEQPPAVSAATPM